MENLPYLGLYFHSIWPNDLEHVCRMFLQSSDVTIIESEIEIKFFLEHRIESKSIFWLVL